MPVPGVDAVKMITVLRRHEVEFVVVGGFAVELWDVPVNPTVDIDITPERSRENLERLAEALNELRAAIRSGAESIPIPGGVTAELLQQMRVVNLITTAGPLDLTMTPAGTDGYRDLVEGAVEITYREVEVLTASLEDVARSKEAAGRPKDLKVLPAIYAYLRRRSG